MFARFNCLRTQSGGWTAFGFAFSGVGDGVDCGWSPPLSELGVLGRSVCVSVFSIFSRVRVGGRLRASFIV